MGNYQPNADKLSKFKIQKESIDGRDQSPPSILRDNSSKEEQEIISEKLLGFNLNNIFENKARKNIEE